MDAPSLSLGIYKSLDVSAAFRGLAENLAATFPLRCALYAQAEDGSIRDRWPQGAEVSIDLLDTALHVLRPEVFPLGSEFPFDASRYPSADLLILPLHRSTEFPAAGVLIADAGAFGEDLQPWEDISEALQDFERRQRRIAEVESRCTDLKRRTEESESLHTLGLAANRTLNKDEVLNLVARFTRTLLGAHYVTVNTIEHGLIHTVASVGLRDARAAAQESELARVVADAEKPLILGGPAANLVVANFPLHKAEGMKAGLGIPLSLFGDTFGALVVGYRREYDISPRDIRLALTLSGHAAVAISNARLHAAVAARSEELAAAYEELRILSQAKERFFASINHELRNPLNAILGYHALLLGEAAEELPAGARSWLEKANLAATTLRAIVDDILDLSKIAAGKMTLELQTCALRDVVAGVMNTIQPLADAKAVPLVVEVDDHLPPLTTDPDRLQQILVNLLSNAVKFTGEGTVRLSASATSAGGGSSDGREAIEIRVSDSGPGIAAEDLKRIFEEYEQVKGTRGGTGLGLPISRRLARALGGDLTAESEVGAGSTFILCLPLSDTVRAPEPEAFEAGSA